MKRLILGILVTTTLFVFYSCNEKSGFFGADALKTNADELVASDSEIDNIVENAS
jgi:hypothetical protein